MKRYDIVVPKPDAKDPEKTYWKNVGTLVEFEPTQEKPERGFILELHMFPTTTFKVFAQKPGTTGTVSGSTTAGSTLTVNGGSNDGVDVPPEDQRVDDIPF